MEMVHEFVISRSKRRFWPPREAVWRATTAVSFNIVAVGARSFVTRTILSRFPFLRPSSNSVPIIIMTQMPIGQPREPCKQRWYSSSLSNAILFERTPRLQAPSFPVIVIGGLGGGDDIERALRADLTVLFYGTSNYEIFKECLTAEIMLRE
jgi:hypothetical protein